MLTNHKHDTIGLNRMLGLCILGKLQILGGCLCLGLIFLLMVSDRCTLCFKLRSSSVCLQLSWLVGFLLRRWYRHVSSNVFILLQYVFVSRTTLVQSQSTGRIVIVSSCFRFLRASHISLVMLGQGGLACQRILLTVCLTVSACSESSVLIADLTLATFSMAGMLDGVSATLSLVMIPWYC